MMLDRREGRRFGAYLVVGQSMILRHGGRVGVVLAVR